MSKSQKSQPVILNNERVRIYVPEYNLTLYVRVDCDGDFWIENADADTSIWIPKRAARAVITALTRATGF